MTTQKFFVRQDERSESGFTLIELLVVILIIGVLSAIAVPAFLNQRKSATEASLKSDLKSIAVSMETEAVKTAGKYPKSSLPSDFKASDGNVFQLITDEAGTVNVAAGSEGSETIRPGRVGWLSNIREYPIKSELGDATRYTYTSTETNYGGPYWDYVPPAKIAEGTPFTGSLDVRVNRELCFELRFEQHKDTPGWSTIRGENTCVKPGEWTTMTVSGVTSYEVTQLTLIAYAYHENADTFDFRNQVIVLGSEINQSAVSLGIDERYCIQGHNESNPENIWSYSKIKGGVKEGRC